MMEKEVYNLIPTGWHSAIRMYTEEEFTSVVTIDGERRVVGSREITNQFNEDRFDPRDGEIVRAADRLAAFIEAYAAIRNGSASPDLQEARWAIRNEYAGASLNIGGINIGEIYADFD
jgi:putative hydrolases of HD superfamily